MTTGGVEAVQQRGLSVPGDRRKRAPSAGSWDSTGRAESALPALRQFLKIPTSLYESPKYLQ